MAGWRNVHLGVEGDDLEIGGLKIWKHPWITTGDALLQLPHPSYANQVHRFNVYEVRDRRPSVRFAAAELSNGVWGFYVSE